MEKRGQVTTFVILGIFIVALTILIVYLRNQYFFPATSENLNEKLAAIQGHIKDCIQNVGDEPIRRIGLQGGYLRTPSGTYRLDNDISVSYLCYNIPDKVQCSNRMLTLENMESQLNDALKESLKTCININKFERGFDLSSGVMNVNTQIGNENVLVEVVMSITLRKDEVTVKADKFSFTFDYPLGKLYDVSQDIIDVETEFGEFEQLTYMLAHRGEFVVDKKKPYPDKLYILKAKDSDYVFQFFIQGEPS